MVPKWLFFCCSNRLHNEISSIWINDNGFYWWVDLNLLHLIQIKLNKNYRSTHCILEAASSLIQNNVKRCQSMKFVTDNPTGSRVCINMQFFYLEIWDFITLPTFYLLWLKLCLDHNAQITVKECQNDEAQCAFVVDKIMEIASDDSAAKRSFGSIAVLYRRQVKLSVS